MSFRRRNVAVTGTLGASNDTKPGSVEKKTIAGVRPSAIDGRPTTSTGNVTLDGLLAGHGGLALGTSLLIEENGTTDYAGALLRFYAAEGLVQGQVVHVIGFTEQWGRELPGVVGGQPEEKTESKSDKMKIAWRYERLGQFGTESSRVQRPTGGSAQTAENASVFSHTFDLTKRLIHPPTAQLHFIPLDANPSKSPFDQAIAKLSSTISASPANIAHRIITPSLLSPALYPPHACKPSHILKFQHNLRSLLATYSTRLTIMQSIPLSLHPRTTGLTKWLELLSDGVLELVPFPHSADAEFQAPRDSETREEPPQGILKVHRIPIFHDRASGTVSIDTDWTFTLSRRKFTIKPFNLPPIETESTSETDKPKKTEIEF